MITSQACGHAFGRFVYNAGNVQPISLKTLVNTKICLKKTCDPQSWHVSWLYMQRGQELKHPVISSLCTLMWQPHHSGYALPPPPKGRGVSEDTQGGLVYSEHSCEQVDLRAILVIFNIFGLLKIKEYHQSFLSYVSLF